MIKNFIISIVWFTLVLNLSVGIMTLSMPAFNPATSNNVTLASGMADLGNSQVNTIIGEMNVTIKPTGGTAADEDTLFRGTLDFIQIANVNKLIKAISTVMFGFTQYMSAIFGPYMIGDDGSTALKDLIFGGLMFLQTFGYLFLAVDIWRWKD